MKNKFICIPDEHPAFVAMFDLDVENDCGYTLLFDENQLHASIIILKKGGTCLMKKAIDGFEHLYAELLEMKGNLESRKEAEKAKALEEVERRFEIESNQIDKAIDSVTKEVEEPVEETIDNAEVVEEVEIVAEETSDNSVEQAQ